ncbi:MAG: DNA methyltransferase [Candidatus Bathyarchaeia archaeon]|uniref:DNA methyltransferase n=1 Tax=Candidatus Hadarchaeum sp. TaxID=2883567 RepID=UPI00317A1AAC
MQVEDWDFAKADIHYMTHGIHPYPARMIPQVAKRLIERYSSTEQVVLDPFCGSGGVLLEAILNQRIAYGIDINPLACLIAKVKTNPIDPSLLVEEWRRLRNKIDLARNFEKLEVGRPAFYDDIKYWFKDYVIEDLSLLRKLIDSEIKNEDIRSFMNVCFSNTVRLVSGTRKGEFKLYRIPEKTWKTFKPNVFRTFEERVTLSIGKMGEFYQHYNKLNKKFKATIIEGDSRDLLSEKFPCGELTEESVDLIVTSPPYGDSKTTVAYGQFSKLSLLWLGYGKEVALEVDKKSIGGSRNHHSISSKTLDLTISKIPDPERAKEVLDFFVDLTTVLERLERVMRKGAHACFVLGNRTVKSIKIPSDEILIEIGKEYGLKHVTTIYRRIPSKRIPWMSSPTNVKGEKVGTISKESIVILKK